MGLRKWWLSRRIDADLVVKIIRQEASGHMASFDTKLMGIVQMMESIDKRLNEIAAVNRTRPMGRRRSHTEQRPKHSNNTHKTRRKRHLT